MLTVNTNLFSLNAQRHLNAPQTRLTTSMQRLASGLRINSAKDDAAGLAVAEKMTAEIRTNAQVQRGISDGISLVQVAEGGLSSVTEILQRMRELAVQSANATWSDQERGLINVEFIELRKEIDRLVDSTEIFGTFPLKGGFRTPPATIGSAPIITTRFPTSGATRTFSSGIVSLAFIPAGARNFTIDMNSLGADDDLELFTRDGQHLVGTPFTGANPDPVWINNGITSPATAQSAMLTTANGFLPGASYDASSIVPEPATYTYPGGVSSSVKGMTVKYSGDGDRYETGADFNNGSNNEITKIREVINIDVVTEDLMLVVAGSGSFTATASWDFMPAPGVTNTDPPPATKILTSAPVGGTPGYLDIAHTAADTQTLGVDTIDLGTQPGAVAALDALDQALQTVGGYRASFGAHSSSLEHRINALSVAVENASAARSRILDTDFAAETAELTRNQIQREAALAMLAQANQIPQQVLALLR